MFNWSTGICHSCFLPPKTKEDSLKRKGVNEHKFKQFGDVFISTIEKALLTVEESEVLDVSEKTSGTKTKSSADLTNQLDIF